ncbi:histidine phosphatase family protein [Paenarthrobacter aurescens]|jgi:broad specificity phosphatase PhoE|nr:histidine phosphatase family protein [Paenarthrobacter aurescens]
MICRDSAAALGLGPHVVAGPSPADYGTWRGLTLSEVPPSELDQWRRDPGFVGHGGESIFALIDRTVEWLRSLPADEDLVVVTHSENIRASVAAATGGVEQYWTGGPRQLRPFEAYAIDLPLTLRT